MMRRRNEVASGAGQRRIVYRVVGGEAGRESLPLVVRSAGRHAVDPGFREAHPGARWFTQLFWTVEGSARFEVDGESRRVTAGEVFIYRPEERHVFTAEAGGWTCRWITLDGRDTWAVLGMFGLARGGRAGPCPQRWFDEVERALERPTWQGVRAASVAAYAILEAASRRAEGPGGAGEGGLAESVRRKLDESFRRPDAGVETVADALGRHRTTVLRSFVAEFGVTPSVYLARRRLQHALTLLRSTAMPVAEVATEAGFRSPEYLARVVRAETGRGPRAFRELGTKTKRLRLRAESS